MPTFRLDLEPWIPVQGCEGEIPPLNLLDAFEQARNIKGVAGSPVEAVSIMRFLLAIVHLTETPTSLSHWASLWADGQALMEKCASYVRAHEFAWDLYGPVDAFGQDTTIETTLNPAHLLLYEAARKNNPVLADHRCAEFPAAVPAEALARGLLTSHAFSGSSGGGYRSGPLAMRTVAFLTGESLEETLILNLLVASSPQPRFDWRRYGQQRTLLGSPPNVVERYLWTSRRVRILPEASGTSSSQMLLGPGEEMSDVERALDPMVVMRRDAKNAGYVPLRLEADRAFWRSAHLFLAANQEARPIIAIQQLQKLRSRGVIADDKSISLRICAVAGDAQGPSTDLWRDELLPFGLSVVSDEARYRDLTLAIDSAEQTATKLRKRIFSFAVEYIQNGLESKASKDDAGTLVDELSPALGDFWSVLAPWGERIACDEFDERRWSDLLRGAAEAAFRKAIDRLPATSRRFRAEFHRRAESDNAKKRQGASA